MTGSIVAGRRRLIGSRRARSWAGLLALEALALVVYFAAVPADVVALRYLLYPFVWINAGVWAVRRISPVADGPRHRALGLAVAAAYFLAVMAIPGKLGFGVAGAAMDLRVGWYAPGWGPLLAFQSPWLRLFLVPFEVVGYGALSYLVYANALQFAREAFSGALGLVTCVGCTVPVLAPAVGLLGGPASSLTTTAYAWSYDVGTVIFILTLGLLVASHEGRLPWR